MLYTTFNFSFARVDVESVSDIAHFDHISTLILGRIDVDNGLQHQL